MDDISGRLVESLRTLGLTEYEARVYSSLVGMGHSDARQIYEYLGASKPNVYESLKSLTDRGFVLTISAKPAIYKAAPYELVLKRLLDAHKSAEETARAELCALEQIRAQDEASPALWTLFGDRNIYNKLEVLLTGATSTVRGIVPAGDYPALAFLMGKDVDINLIVKGDGDPVRKFGLRTAKVRNLAVKVATPLKNLDSEFEEFHKMLSEDVTLFIVDDREFVYILPASGMQRTGITSDSPSIVRMISLIFRFAWGKSGRGQA